MDFIETLFKQPPFIYYISGRYYALGSYVCSECDMRSITLEGRYKEYEESVDENLSTQEAWRIFHRLIFKAECVRDEVGYCNAPQKELLKFRFNEEEMNDLKSQVERYVAYWQKYSFSTFLH